MRLLNDYGMIISIETNKKAYVCVCSIVKIGDATSTRIYFPILVRALKWESRFTYVLVKVYRKTRCSHSYVKN